MESKEPAGIDKKALFLEAYKRKLTITRACEAVGITRRTFYNWLNTDPEFRARFEETREALIDLAEAKLFELIKRGNLGAIIFYLKTQAKHRGYTDRPEEASQQVKIIVPLELLPLGLGKDQRGQLEQLKDLPNVELLPGPETEQ